MDPALGAFGLAFLALILSTLHQRRERAASRSLAAQQRAALGQLAEEVTSLREALVHSGAVAGPAMPPPDVVPPLPSVKREVVTVTRDDDPIHTRPTVEAPPPAGEACATDEPPSTKPSQSRKIPASAAPESAPRPVPFEDQIARAMKRIERQARVPPEVEARWEARLRALGAELGLAENAEPTDAQLDAMIRELYQAEADVKDARDAATPAPRTAAATLAPPPLAVRIAEAAARGPDADGEVTLRQEGDRPTTLPKANVDDDAEDAGEDKTKVFKPPRPIDTDPLAGVPLERPTSSATRTAGTFRSRPTLLGGIIARSDPPNEGDPS